jgi:hypothetical protein
MLQKVIKIMRFRALTSGHPGQVRVHPATDQAAWSRALRIGFSRGKDIRTHGHRVEAAHSNTDWWNRTVMPSTRSGRTVRVPAFTDFQHRREDSGNECSGASVRAFSEL